MKYTVKRDDLIHPELSFKIVGCAFEVYNELGPGLKEDVYQKALAECFRKHNISFIEQDYLPIKFNNKTIRKGYSDFLVENKVVVEIKKSLICSPDNIKQINNYLKSSSLSLAILIQFGNNKVFTKRIINTNP